MPIGTGVLTCSLSVTLIITTCPIVKDEIKSYLTASKFLAMFFENFFECWCLDLAQSFRWKYLLAFFGRDWPIV